MSAESSSVNEGHLEPNTTVVFVLGGPGAGKGTQCANLVRDFNFVHLSAGDLLRAEQETPNSPYGELIRSFIKEGQIVPMDVTIKLLRSAIVLRNKDCKRFLIDGFPRKLDQALKFEEECTEEEMLKRLLKRGETSGRIDDNVESIQKRFKTFIETSYPVVEYYAKLNKVKTVSSAQTVDQVYAQTKSHFINLFDETK